jgi:hypothetical protein
VKNQVIICGAAAGAAVRDGFCGPFIDGTESVHEATSLVKGLSLAKAFAREACKTTVVFRAEEVTGTFEDVDPSIGLAAIEDFLEDLPRVTRLVLKLPGDDTKCPPEVDNYRKAVKSLSEKIRAAASTNPKQAPRVGGRPFVGYRILKGVMTPDPARADSIRTLFQCRDQGLRGSELITVAQAAMEARGQHVLRERAIYRILNLVSLYRDGNYVNHLGESISSPDLIIAPHDTTPEAPTKAQEKDHVQ